jgi:hypothetical protein
MGLYNLTKFQCNNIVPIPSKATVTEVVSQKNSINSICYAKGDVKIQKRHFMNKHLDISRNYG